MNGSGPNALIHWWRWQVARDWKNVRDSNLLWFSACANILRTPMLLCHGTHLIPFAVIRPTLTKAEGVRQPRLDKGRVRTFMPYFSNYFTHRKGPRGPTDRRMYILMRLVDVDEMLPGSTRIENRVISAWAVGESRRTGSVTKSKHLLSHPPHTEAQRPVLSTSVLERSPKPAKVPPHSPFRQRTYRPGGLMEPPLQFYCATPELEDTIQSTLGTSIARVGLGYVAICSDVTPRSLGRTKQRGDNARIVGF